jgi:hypothetical protein
MPPAAFPEWFRPNPGAVPSDSSLADPATVTVVRDTGVPLQQPILIGTFPAVLPPAGNELTLGPGSVLISTSQVAADSPANTTTGFPITSGLLTFPGNITVIQGFVLIGTNDILEMAVELDVPAPPGPITGPGVDAAAAVVNLPSSIKAVFAPAGMTIGNARLTAQVYGSSVQLTRQDLTSPHYDTVLQQILVPTRVSPNNFAIVTDQSPLLTLSGSAAITEGAWALPVVNGPALPGAILPAGSAAIILGSGITAQWLGLAQPLAVQSSAILAAPGKIGVMLTIANPAFTDVLQLWQERGGARNSTIEFHWPANLTLPYTTAPGAERLQLTNGSAVLHLDRPLRADGARVALTLLSASQTLDLSVSDLVVTVSGSLQLPPNNSPFAMAIENALLQVVMGPDFSLSGALTGGAVSAGTLGFVFGAANVIPTLPDPYASSVPAAVLAQRRKIAGVLNVSVQWAAPDAPALHFGFQDSQSTTFNTLPALLDVSGNADLLGVEALSDAAEPLTIDGMTLQAKGSVLGIFTVPEISWEPMVQDPSSPPPSGSLAPPDDGDATTFSVQTTQLVPIAPALLAPIFVDAAAAGVAATVQLSLPFGIQAQISDFTGATVALNQPQFPGSLAGAIQIKLVSPNPLSTEGAFVGASLPLDTYGTNVLGSDVANFFNQQFAGAFPFVPLHRYDISGYGASVFSEWTNDSPSVAGVIKVQFGVFVGRTALDVIQIRSLIYPWGIRVVRTVTIDRANLGGVIRHDSGWQAVSNGDFSFPNQNAFTLHQGAIQDLVRVRNIQDAGAVFPTTGPPPQWRPVTFDCDVLLDPQFSVQAGAAPTNGVVSRGVTGYLLETVTPPFIPSASDVANLLADNPAGGPLSCTVAVAASGTQLRASGFDATGFFSAGQVVIACALRGSPLLPPDGAWSVGKRATFNTAPPLPLDANFPIPLVQNFTQRNLWYYADPSDILNLPLGTPVSEYGLLQSTGTQKLFFAQPRMEINTLSIQPQAPPHMADVGALLNATGIFPDLKAALQMNSSSADLDTSSSNGFKFHNEFDTVDVSKNPLPSQTLIDFGADTLQLLLAYSDGNGHPGSAVVDIQPGSWNIQLKNISFPIITPFGDETSPLLRIVGDAQASSTSAPTLTNLAVQYGGALSEVEQVFSQIEHIASFLPGAPFATLDVHFSNGQLTIRDVFALPQVPLGVGFVEDVTLDLGMTLQLSPQSLEFTVGLGSERTPFHWLVFPLSGTGAVVVGMKDGLPAFLVQGGIGAGLAIDIGIAKGAASIVLQVQLATDGKAIHLKALLTGSASVDVLDGLASASLTLTAGLGISPDPLPGPPDFSPPQRVSLVASVAVGVHISVCWVVSVDFDGYWQYSQTIELPGILAELPV